MATEPLGKLEKGTIAFHADNLPSKKPLEDPYMLWHGTNNENLHDTISQVREFEQACGATLYPLGQVPPLDKLKLRLSLELEELYEKAQAMGLEGTFQSMLYDRLQQKDCLSATHDSWDGYYKIETNFDPDSGNYDPVELLDACCDQRYVQDGTMLTCGLDAAFPEAFAEVNRSNMSKFPVTMSEAVDTLKHYETQGIKATWDVGSIYDKTMTIRRDDGKILKSINYSPAELAPIIQKYTA